MAVIGRMRSPAGVLSGGNARRIGQSLRCLDSAQRAWRRSGDTAVALRRRNAGLPRVAVQPKARGSAAF